MRRSCQHLPKLVDKEIDIDLPRALWEGFLTAGKPRYLRAELTRGQRAVIEARRAELAPWMAAFHDQERDEVALALMDMFGGFVPQGGAEGGMARVDALAGPSGLLARFPAWAIKRACERFRLRGWERRDRDKVVVEKNWAPTDPVIVEAIEKEVALYSEQYQTACMLLTATVDPESRR